MTAVRPLPRFGVPDVDRGRVIRMRENDPLQALAAAGSWPRTNTSDACEARLLEPLCYLGIVVFNLAITFWIGKRLLGLLGCLLFLRRAGAPELEPWRSSR
jgi:hypothetical protein